MVDRKKIEQVIGPIVKIIETHMSIIYIGYCLAAKEIKAVNLGFVNLESFEARMNAAIKTAEIDFAYCPDLQSKAVEIDGTPFIIMRRFDSSQGLDRLYSEGLVTEEYARQIGVLFAQAHRKAKIDAEISIIGYTSILINWRELFEVTMNFAQAVGKTISEDDYRLIVSVITKFIDQHDCYFQERRDKGFMRQCHGDGHCGNMFVESGQVKIFDGIGFKKEFSFMDPVSDIAFPIMDAIVHDRRDIAEAIKVSYIAARPEDANGVERLLGFYICYRAFVRGQISTMIANGLSGEEQENMLQLARKYYQLAVEFLPGR